MSFGSWTRERFPRPSVRSMANRRSSPCCPPRPIPSCLEAYRGLMEGWQSDSHAIEVRLGRGRRRPPGRPSRLACWTGERLCRPVSLPRTCQGCARTSPRWCWREKLCPSTTILWSLRGDIQPTKRLAIGWLVVEPLEAVPGMGRKLPHYGKYSYLAFEGDEPSNVVKGQWPTGDSPLFVDLRPPQRAEHGAAGSAAGVASGSDRPAAGLLTESPCATRAVSRCRGAGG